MYLLQGLVNLNQRFSPFYGRDNISCHKTCLAICDPRLQNVRQMTNNIDKSVPHSSLPEERVYSVNDMKLNMTFPDYYVSVTNTLC